MPHDRTFALTQRIESPGSARPSAVRASTIVAGSVIVCFVALVGLVSALSGKSVNTRLLTDTVTVTPSTGTRAPVAPQPASTASQTPSAAPLNRSSQPRVTVTKTIPLPYELPGGFGWFKPYDGIGVRLMDASEFECRDGQPKCFGIEVFSGPGCPGGATVMMTMHATTNEAEVGQSRETTAAIPAGGWEEAIVGYDPHGIAVTGDVTGISC